MDCPVPEPRTPALLSRTSTDQPAYLSRSRGPNVRRPQAARTRSPAHMWENDLTCPNRERIGPFPTPDVVFRPYAGRSAIGVGPLATSLVVNRPIRRHPGPGRTLHHPTPRQHRDCTGSPNGVLRWVVPGPSRPQRWPLSEQPRAPPGGESYRDAEASEAPPIAVDHRTGTWRPAKRSQPCAHATPPTVCATLVEGA